MTKLLLRGTIVAALAAGVAFNQADDLTSASDSLVYPLTAVVAGNGVVYHERSAGKLQQAALSYRLAETKGREVVKR